MDHQKTASSKDGAFLRPRRGADLPRKTRLQRKSRAPDGTRLFWRAARDASLLRKSADLGDRRDAAVPASAFAAENGPPDCFLHAAHPLRLRIPCNTKAEHLTALGFPGALQGMRLCCANPPTSATAALRQYPPRPSRLKTVRRTVFFTPLTLSGFESLATQKPST